MHQVRAWSQGLTLQIDAVGVGIGAEAAAQLTGLHQSAAARIQQAEAGSPLEAAEAQRLFAGAGDQVAGGGVIGPFTHIEQCRCFEQGAGVDLDAHCAGRTAGAAIADLVLEAAFSLCDGWHEQEAASGLQGHAAANDAAVDQPVDQIVVFGIERLGQVGHQRLVGAHRVGLVLGHGGIVVAAQHKPQRVTELVADAADAGLGALLAPGQLQLAIDHVEAVVDLHPLVASQAVEQGVVELEGPVDDAAIGPLIDARPLDGECLTQGIAQLLAHQIGAAGCDGSQGRAGADHPEGIRLHDLQLAVLAQLADDQAAVLAQLDVEG